MENLTAKKDFLVEVKLFLIVLRQQVTGKGVWDGNWIGKSREDW